MRRLHPVICIPRLIVYLIVLVICILPAVFLNTLFGYVPLLFSVLFPLLSLGYARWMAARVQCTGISEGAECVRGKSIPMQLTIENRSRLTVVSCRAVFYTTDLDGEIRTSEELHLTLASQEHRSFAFDVLFDHLGLYDVGLQALRIDGLLGILSFERSRRRSRTVRVLPNIHRLDAFTISELVQNESPHASHTSSAESIDFASVREYAFGDPIKLIHWKLSSHTGTYVTKQMEAYGNHGLTILADNSVPGYSSESRMNVYDALIECAAALGRRARDNGMDVELLYRDRTGAVSRQPLDCSGSFSELLDELPSLKISREASRLSEMLRLEAAGRQTNSNIAVCTAVLDDDAGDAIQNLALSGKIPVVFYLRPYSEAQAGEHGLRVLKTLRSRGISCCLVESADEIGKGAMA